MKLEQSKYDPEHLVSHSFEEWRAEKNIFTSYRNREHEIKLHPAIRRRNMRLSYNFLKFHLPSSTLCLQDLRSRQVSWPVSTGGYHDTLTVHNLNAQSEYYTMQPASGPSRPVCRYGGIYLRKDRYSRQKHVWTAAVPDAGRKKAGEGDTDKENERNGRGGG